MPMKGDGTTEPRRIDESGDGVGWIAYPDEGMQRASHALATDAGTLLIDPVDADGVSDIYAAYGDVGGVAVLLDRHTRDAETFADRHDVPIYAPPWMDIDGKLDRPAEPLTEFLADTAYDCIDLDVPVWQEAVLTDGETLVVPEALGTVGYFCAGDEPIGVHPMLRLFPPRALREHDIERVRVGHGAGIAAETTMLIRDAIDNARRRLPKAYVGALRDLL
ncbi:MAG: hypothetical protein U5K28_03140 [Halobacteriales archaeon]|nr:hypothetical protein [Halobacteriales archaeon]